MAAAQAAAAGGGGGGGGPAGAISYSTALTTPLILSNILTGAQLIRAGIATPDEEYMWFDKFFRAEKDREKNGKLLVNNLWLQTMGPKERAARWDMYLTGTIVNQEGYFNPGQRYYREQFVGNDRKSMTNPQKWIDQQKAIYQDKVEEHPLNAWKTMTPAAAHLEVKKEVAKWSEQRSPRFYAYILYALTAPLPEDVEINRNPYVNAHRYTTYKEPQSTYLNRVAKINTGKTRGGKRSATKRRASRRHCRSRSRSRSRS
jgi:hypothetical protein